MFFHTNFLQHRNVFGDSSGDGKVNLACLVYHAMNIYTRLGRTGVEQFFLGLMPASIVNPGGYRRLDSVVASREKKRDREKAFNRNEMFPDCYSRIVDSVGDADARARAPTSASTWGIYKRR